MTAIHEQKNDTTLFSSIQVDTKNKITSFEMLGWTDPNQSNPQKPLKWLKSLSIDVNVYPSECFADDKPPRCIFVPETAIFNKMIETVAKHSENRHILYAKFSDMDQPKPQWMIDQDKEMKRQKKLLKAGDSNADSLIDEVSDEGEDDDEATNTRVTEANADWKSSSCVLVKDIWDKTTHNILS